MKNEMFNCFVVDDDAASIEILHDYIGQSPELRLAYSTTNPREIFNAIGQYPEPRISFLDIEMEGINGLELAGLINSHTAVIFITSHIEHAVDAFEKDAFDFLVKPFSYARFLQAVLKAQSRIRQAPTSKQLSDTYFFIRGNKQGQLIKIPFDEVFYIESLQNYVKVHTVKGMYITYLTLKEFEFKLNRSNFMKVHKSFVINIDKISNVIDNELRLENGAAVPVGAVYREGLQQALRSKIFVTSRRKEADS